MSSISEKRVALLRELNQCARRMMFGTVSETYRTCGQRGCRCHQGEKHGPFTQISYRGRSGKTTGYHVPRGLEERVKEAVSAWHRFQEIAREIAELNREQEWSRHRQRRKQG
jgi:hypothetical protein